MRTADRAPHVETRALSWPTRSGEELNDGHGNLGDRDVDAGDTLVVPRSIGEFRTTLRPIPLSEKLQEDHPDEDARGGALGVVFL